MKASGVPAGAARRDRRGATWPATHEQVVRGLEARARRGRAADHRVGHPRRVPGQGGRVHGGGLHVPGALPARRRCRAHDRRRSRAGSRDPSASRRAYERMAAMTATNARGRTSSSRGRARGHGRRRREIAGRLGGGHRRAGGGRRRPGRAAARRGRGPPGRRLPGHAGARSTPTTTSTRTSPAPIGRRSTARSSSGSRTLYPLWRRLDEEARVPVGLGRPGRAGARRLHHDHRPPLRPPARRRRPDRGRDHRRPRARHAVPPDPRVDEPVGEGRRAAARLGRAGRRRDPGRQRAARRGRTTTRPGARWCASRWPRARRSRSRPS